MKFSDFERNGTVKIKPIELNFWQRGPHVIYLIEFDGKDVEKRFRFNFYYRDGFALHGVFRDENHFEQFTKDVEKI